VSSGFQDTNMAVNERPIRDSEAVGDWAGHLTQY